MFGVITDTIDCPQCGFPCAHDTYHITGETKDACPYCGYIHIIDLDRDVSSQGYGCIHYHFKDGRDEIIPLKDPLSQEGVNRVLERIQNECDSEKSSFYLWDSTGLQCIHGTMPKTLNDVYEEQCNLANAMMELRFAKLCHEEDQWHMSSK